ncbi:MAG: hypothetical protein WD875_05860 [Pirellulales bacterium]
MKRMAAFLAIAFFSATPAPAFWSVSDSGAWPDSWPKELEPLRKQARSYTGGGVNRTFHEIRITKREEFEAAWPQLLKVKSEGAPIILVRGPVKYLGPLGKGVRVWMALPSSKPVPAGPIAGVRNPREKWLYTTFIELVVDGDVVDLNRIALPPDTPIIDERFVDRQDNKTK